MAEKASENLTFEAALEKLQKTVKQLEGGELSLEESLKAFEEGVRLTRQCQQQLGAAEQKVDLLMKTPADVESQDAKVPKLQPYHEKKT